jgi:putative phosphonate metabolism protein
MQYELGAKGYSSEPMTIAEADKNASRYGIYFSPSQGSLLEILGCRWLGRVAESGESGDQFLHDTMKHEEWRRVTESPRRYGFHATLKPPFRLSESATFVDLQRALQDFASRHKSFMAPALRVNRLGHFLALTLSEPSQPFTRLASASVAEFERFRAPATAQELARRLHGSLSSREREHVLRWGYPYVFDTWQFHMTLTGALPPSSLSVLERYLAQRFAPVTQESWLVDSVCIFHEPYPEAAFQLVSRASLGSS